MQTSRSNDMAKLITEFTMSLDGYIAGPNDEVDRLFGWYSSGDTVFQLANSPLQFKVSRASAELLQQEWSNIGALITGRRDFDVSGAWGGKLPVGEHAFIVTHTVPPEWASGGAPFTFVTDGVASAVAQARAFAGDRAVAIGGTTIVRQCLDAGLLDEIQIDLVPLLLGAGIRLFEQLGVGPLELERIGTIEGIGVIHLRFRVIK
jgi:dihydrofolate reductase